MREKARQLLLQEEEQNSYMLYRLEQGMADDLEIAGSSVRMRDVENGKYMYAVKSPDELAFLYRKISGRSGMLLSLLTDGRMLKQALSMEAPLRGGLFYQLLPPESRTLSARGFEGGSEESDVEFTPVQAADIPWMLRVYEHPELNEEFIGRRAAAAPAIVARKNNVPVGFAMTHCGAELGPVYVEPQLRGSGLAAQLLCRLLQGMEQKKSRAMIFVAPTNLRSLHWLQKQGCQLCREHVAWFWREE